MTDHHEAAHAASELDDYATAAPEGAAISIGFALLAVAVVGVLAMLAVFA